MGNGYIDAATGGVVGILIGAGLFAAVYPRLMNGILRKGDFGDITIPRLIKVPECIIVPIVAMMLVFILLALESKGM